MDPTGQLIHSHGLAPQMSSTAFKKALETIIETKSNEEAQAIFSKIRSKAAKPSIKAAKPCTKTAKSVNPVNPVSLPFKAVRLLLLGKKHLKSSDIQLIDNLAKRFGIIPLTDSPTASAPKGHQQHLFAIIQKIKDAILLKKPFPLKDYVSLVEKYKKKRINTEAKTVKTAQISTAAKFAFGTIAALCVLSSVRYLVSSPAVIPQPLIEPSFSAVLYDSRGVCSLHSDDTFMPFDLKPPIKEWSLTPATGLMDSLLDSLNSFSFIGSSYNAERVDLMVSLQEGSFLPVKSEPVSEEPLGIQNPIDQQVQINSGSSIPEEPISKTAISLNNLKVISDKVIDSAKDAIAEFPIISETAKSASEAAKLTKGNYVAAYGTLSDDWRDMDVTSKIISIGVAIFSLSLFPIIYAVQRYANQQKSISIGKEKIAIRNGQGKEKVLKQEKAIGLPSIVEEQDQEDNGSVTPVRKVLSFPTDRAPRTVVQKT